MKVQPKQAHRSGVFAQTARQIIRRASLRLVMPLFVLFSSFLHGAVLAQDQSTGNKVASEPKVDVEPLDQLRERISKAQGRERSLLQNQLLDRIDAPIDERSIAAEELIQTYSGTIEYWLLGNALSSKGTVTLQRGDLAGAIELLSQAEEVLAKVKDEYPEDYFDCRCNKAACLLSAGQSEKATVVLQECIDFAKPYEHRLNVPYAHVLLAHLAEGAGAVEQSLESLETAFRMAVDSKKTRLAAMTGETIVAVLFISQQYDLANDWVKRAEPYIRDCGDPRIVFSFKMRVEDLRRVNGDPQTAVANLKALLANADGTIDRPIIGVAYMSLIAAQLKAGQHDEAIATADLAIEKLQGFERNLLQARVNRLAAFFEKADYELVERESAALIDGSKSTPVLPTIDLLELRVKTLEKLGRFQDALGVAKDLRELERKTLTERATEQANFISIMFRQEQQTNELAIAQKEKQTSEDKQKFLELNTQFLEIKSQRERWIRNAILIGAIALLVVTVLLTRMMLNRRASRELAEREREYNRLLSQKLEDQTRAFVAETKSRRQLELAVEQKHRDEALGKLTGGVAHDFNNLLMVILNSCELARTTGPKLPVETEQLLESSIRAAESGASIVRQLLAYAKQQPLAPRMTSVADWFAGASPLFRRTVGHLISFTQEDRSGHAVIRIDIARLTTAVINLLANARDAIPSVGSVRLTVLVESNGTTLGRRWPSVDADSVVIIEITDSGTGMSPEILAHACEPFFTTKTEGTGTGLGLSSVVGFVRQSGGDFELSSTVEQGTTARILLPLITATSESLKTIKISPRHSDQRVVLLVEDQDSLRFVIGVQLKALGYEVVDVADAAAAVQWLEKSPPPEIVISDVRMPGSMNGIQLRSWILSRYPSVHVILMSGHLDVQVDQDVVFLQKPVTQQDLKLLLGSLPA